MSLSLGSAYQPLGTNSGATALGTLDGVKLANVSTPATNVLSWYEEGTFTPVLKFGGASVGITYSLQSGRFTRIGRMVQYEVRIILTSKGSSTGQCTITGAPYATANRVYAAILVSGMASTYNSPNVEMDTSTWFPGNVVSGSNNGISNTDFTNTSTISFTGTYSV